jgi:plastocyanin
MRRLSAFGLLLSACALARVPIAESREPRTVNIAAFKFTPAELTVSPGDTVTWINDDTFVHTTASDSGTWISQDLSRGQRFSFVAARTGRFPYHCRAHPVMRAIIVVRE